MADAIDITRGRQGKVLTDVEVLLAKEQDPFWDQVALHNHQGDLLWHLEGESVQESDWMHVKCAYESYEEQGAVTSHSQDMWRWQW